MIHDLTSLFFRELPILREVISEVTPGHDIYHEIQILPILKGVVHVHQKPIIDNYRTSK
jgi:hypothetical protein